MRVWARVISLFHRPSEARPEVATAVDEANIAIAEAHAAAAWSRGLYRAAAKFRAEADRQRREFRR